MNDMASVVKIFFEENPVVPLTLDDVRFSGCLDDEKDITRLFDVLAHYHFEKVEWVRESEDTEDCEGDPPGDVTYHLPNNIETSSFEEIPETIMDEQVFEALEGEIGHVAQNKVAIAQYEVVNDRIYEKNKEMAFVGETVIFDVLNRTIYCKTRVIETVRKTVRETVKEYEDTWNYQT